MKRRSGSHWTVVAANSLIFVHWRWHRRILGLFDSGQCQQRLGRSIELGAPLLDLFRDLLAQFVAELVEGIDAHQHGVGERAVLMKRDQRAERGRADFVEQDRRRGTVPRIGARRIAALLAGHQRRALRKAIRQQDTVMHRSQIMAERSEEHTSELQSLMRISYAVFCLKKKNKKKNTNITSTII